MSPSFNTDFDPQYGCAVKLFDAPLVRRVTADNAGPYTFTGTNSFLVGRKSCCVIDPGPDDIGHLRRLMETAETQGFISHILLTHTHLDHTAGVAQLKQMTGAKTFGFGPHAIASSGGNMDFRPDVTLADADQIYGEDWSLTAHHTPGHCQTHLCFGLDGTDVLFSGDHVMGWSTSVIIPPDGNLRDYFNSLDLLQDLPQTTYLPAHGDGIEDAKPFARAMGNHRKLRNNQILSALTEAPEKEWDLNALRQTIYPDLKVSLHGAAQATLLAHMDFLTETGDVLALGLNRWTVKT